MKYRIRFRVKVSGCSPDLIFFAPNADMAKMFTEMCCFTVLSVLEEPE
jgi:hypothetical protein